MRIRVEDQRQQPIPGAYVAIVPEDAAWSRPLHEALLEGMATFERPVPPGRYRFIAGAPGFRTEFAPPADVDEAGVRDIATVLEPLISVRGKVVDESDAPLAGARVGLAGQFTYDHASLLSPLAEEHLRSNTLARTAADGSFTLPAFSSGGMTVIVEADGFAPLVLEGVRADTRADLGPLRLWRGARLTVGWHGRPPETLDRLTLLPRNVAAHSGTDRDRAVALWTRPLTNGRQVWPALPAGEFDVILRGPPRTSHDLPPVELARVTLTAGEERQIVVNLPAPSSGPPPPARSPLRLLVREVAFDRLRQAIVTAWNGEPARVQAEVAAASGGTLLTVTAPCSPGDVTVETADAIGAVTIRECGPPVPVTLHPRAMLTATLTPPLGATLPARGSFRTGDCPRGGAQTVPYQIRDRQIAVALPAGCGGAFLTLGTFSPLFVPPENLQAVRTHDLGMVALRPGGSVLVRVTSGDGKPAGGATVKAHRPRDLDSLRGRTAPDALAALATGTTDAGGWTRLYGLPGEEVVFTLRGAGRVRADLSDPFRVRAGEELVLDLQLAPPASLHVTLVLAAGLEEALLLDSVEAVPDEGRWPDRFVIGTDASASKIAHLEDVPPGPWKVHALGRLPGGTLAVLGEQSIEMAPGVDQHLTLTIDDLLFRGRVTRAGAPARGILNLQPAKGGVVRRHTVARMRDDGTFQVLLESAGDYIVNVEEADAGQMARMARPVRFEDPDVEVDIALPDGQISGRVVDAAGTPVANAGISATRPGEAFDRHDLSGTRSGPDGTFVLDNISPGNWTIRATARDTASEDLLVHVDDGDLSGLSIVVTPTRRVTIRVTDAAGHPARQAVVAVELPPSGPDVTGEALLRQTDRDGLAIVTVPLHLETNPTNVYVVAFDGTLSCATVRLGGDVVVRVPATAGETRLRRDRWAPPPGVSLRLVSAEGCSVPLIGVAHDQRQGRHDMLLRRLSAGSWRYVELSTPQDHLLAFTGRAALLPSKAPFVVRPGEPAIVTVPD